MLTLIKLKSVDDSQASIMKYRMIKSKLENFRKFLKCTLLYNFFVYT